MMCGVAGGALDTGARRGAYARTGGRWRRSGGGSRSAVLHAGALVAGAPSAHDPRGAAQRRRRRHGGNSRVSILCNLTVQKLAEKKGVDVIKIEPTIL